MTLKAPTCRIMNRLPVLIVFAILTTGCGDSAEPCMTYMETMQVCYAASSVSPKEPQPSISEAAAFCSDYGPEWMDPYFVCMSDIIETLDCSLIVNWKPEIGSATAECIPLSVPDNS